MPEKQIIDSTDKCYLTYDEEGCLVCTYNHKIGERCLGNMCKYCNKLDCICYEGHEEMMIDKIATLSLEIAKSFNDFGNHHVDRKIEDMKFFFYHLRNNTKEQNQVDNAIILLTDEWLKLTKE